MEYLTNEVLGRIPIATKRFLLQTSILDHMCGPLCDAVIPPVEPAWDGRAYLRWLAAENLFTFSLDSKGTWYRYHHLLQRLLRDELKNQYSPPEIAELHARASAWFAENGLVEEAIEHALAAGDEVTAVRLVEAHRHAAMNQENWGQLECWLKLMPRRLIDTRPELLMVEAWILTKQWKFVDLPGYLDRIETLMNQARLPEHVRARLQGEVDALHSHLFYYVFDAERTFDAARFALQTVPLECSFVRATAWLYYAGGLQMKGDIEGAINALYEGLKEDRVHGNAFPSRLYTGLCFAHWMSADLSGLLRSARQMLQMAHQRQLPEASSFAHYFIGCALYQMNDLAGADDEFATVVAQPYTAHSMAYAQSAFGLASIYMARGERDRAREATELAAAYGLQTNNTRIMADAEAFRALLASRSGGLAEAHRWVTSQASQLSIVPMTAFYVAFASRATVLLAVRTQECQEEAAHLLARLYDMTQTTNNTRFLIETLALDAMLQDEQGNRAAALATFEQAIELAEPGGLIRVFVDLGPEIAVLLRQLAGQGAASEYVHKLLDAFDEAPEPRSALRRATTGESELIEPLSERELEVLALLGERLSNKEIASDLVISPMTVKRHTVNIYQKLGVGSRGEAVARAVELGLLPDSLYARRRSQVMK
jgi:LuxR family maltose regulon positive regulatory protein